MRHETPASSLSSKRPETVQPKQQMRVCQNTTCTKTGALAVLHAFQSLEIPELEVVPSGCLGQCGNGPMVLVLPEQVWYRYVKPWDARAIAAQHWGSEHQQTSIPEPEIHSSQEACNNKKTDNERTIESDRSGFWAYGFLMLAIAIILTSVIGTFSN